MPTPSGVRRFFRRPFDSRRGRLGGLVLGPAFVVMVLASVMVPFPNSDGASAAECPPGYVKVRIGLQQRCVRAPRIDPGSLDLGIGDGQIVNDDGAIEGGDPPHQLTPVVVIDIDPIVDVHELTPVTNVPIILTPHVAGELEPVVDDPEATSTPQP